jgi:hypothetical protein
MAMEWLLGLTFLAGGLVGYGLRSLISQRRHRRARAQRRLQHRSHPNEIWALPPNLEQTTSPPEVTQPNDIEQAASGNGTS